MLIGKEILKYSLSRMVHKKFRTFLTILSIFIGIAVIFVFVSFGLGLYDYINEFAGESTADKLSIMPKGNAAPGMDDTVAITDDDIEAVEQTNGFYQATGLYAKPAEVTQDKIKKYTFLIGYDPDKPIVFELMNIGIAEGRELKKGDKGKAVLGYSYLVEDKVFPKAYSLNQKIEIQGREFQIVGFYESVGSPPDDAQIYTTLEDMEELYKDEIKGYAWAVAKVDRENLNTILENVEKSLRKSRDLEKGKEDFFVQSWQDMMETYTLVLDSIIGFVILIALISVLVSAINTANTMITSVLERIREIGVMKAVGARNSDIFNLFLFESSLLGLIAGIMGVGVGWLVSFLAGRILESLGWGFLQPYYSWWLFVSLIAFATLTGAISGAIPAWRASKIRPVDALRYE